MSLESGSKYLLFLIGVGLLGSILVYGSMGSLPIQMPSLPSGQINGLDLVIYILNTLFSFIANGIILLINGITLSWIPMPWRFIIGLPFWALSIFVSIQLISALIDKLKGWL